MVAHARFVDQVAVVTGAGEGIGLAIVRQLAAEGARVFLNDLDGDKAAAAAAVVNNKAAHGGVCHPFAGDVGDVEVVRGLVGTAIGQYGRLDCAVANAGITLWSPFLDYEPDAFYKVLSVNLGGTFFLAQAAARHMKDQGDGGRIVLMSSVTGHQAIEYLSAYGMTKAAIEMLARQLVSELAPLGINVNAIAPGATLTPRNLADDPNYADSWGGVTPIGKVNTADDIADTALFLLSPAAAKITGQTLVVDGGWSAASPIPALDFVEKKD